MLGWLKRIFSPATGASSSHDSPVSRTPRSVDVDAVKRLLASESPIVRASVRDLCAMLDELCARGAFDDALPVLRPAFADVFQRHPYEVRWGKGTEMFVVDPLGVDVDALTRGGAEPELVPWARLVRTLALSTGGVRFPNECGLRDVLALLDDPHAPEAIVSLSFPVLMVEDDASRERFVAALCESPRLRALEHLAFRDVRLLEPRHFEQLASAPWASSLRTLEITEMMVDWSVDYEPEVRHPAYRALGRFRSLTHLSMYNNLDEASDVEALLTEPFPALTHLNLGASLRDPAGLDLLLERLPTLRELSLSDGPPHTDPVWDRIVASGIPTYLHGTRVTETYPLRR